MQLFSELAPVHDSGFVCPEDQQTTTIPEADEEDTMQTKKKYENQFILTTEILLVYGSSFLAIVMYFPCQTIFVQGRNGRERKCGGARGEDGVGE